MRHIRTVMSGALVGVVSLSVISAVPSFAATDVVASSHAASLLKRVIAEDDPNEHRLGFDSFRLEGQVTEPAIDELTGLPLLDPITGEQVYNRYAKAKVKLQQKKCSKCQFKTVKKLKTNKFGKFKARIFAPRKGKWKWRVHVPASNGYAAVNGTTWTTSFR